MSATLSTAISDGTLALVACASAVGLRVRGEKYASTGLAFVSFAAALGSLRYGGAEALTGLHTFATLLAVQVGLPLVGIAYVAAAQRQRVRFDRRLQLAGLVVVGFAIWGVVFPVSSYSTVAVGFAMLGVLVGAAWCGAMGTARAGLGAVGALLVLVAAGLVGQEGVLGAFRRLDLFHVLLAIAVALLGLGLPARAEAPDA